MDQKKIKMKRWRKITALLLSAAMAVSYIPGTVYAAENEVVDGGDSGNEEVPSGNENGEHTHQWDYQREENAIKAVCSENYCTYESADGIYLSINIEQTYNYPARPRAEVILMKDVSGNAITPNYEELGMAEPECKYYKDAGGNEEVRGEGPLEEGTYWVEVAWGGESIAESFAITDNHTHRWEYKKQGTDTISANCTEESGTCEEKASGKYLSINIDGTYNYPARPGAEVILVKDVSGNAIALDYEELGMVKPESKYYKDADGSPGNEEVSGEGPLEEGTYWVEASWGGESITKVFTITDNHTHRWEYKKQGTDTISANCTEESGTCGEKASGKYLSINIKGTYNYPARPEAEVILVKDVSGNAIALDYEELGMAKPESKYYKDADGSPGNEEVSGEGPLEAGKYWVEASWGGEIIARAFTITDNHTHRWEYKKQGTDTISANCTEESGTCEEKASGKYLSINIEVIYNYPARPEAEVILVKDVSGNAIALDYEELGMVKPESKYYKDADGSPGNEEVDAAGPLEAGTYWVEASWGGESIAKSFTITDNHTHRWEYKKQGTDTISANCIEENGTCGEKASGKYLSINIEGTYNYPERPAAEVILVKDVSGNTITLEYEELGMAEPEYKYYKDADGSPGNEEVSGEGPLEAGKYWVEASWGGEIIAKSFTITDNHTHRWEYKKQGTDIISANCTEESGTCGEKASGKYLSINIEGTYNYPARPGAEVILVKDVSGNAIALDYEELGMVKPESKYYKDAVGSPGEEVNVETPLEAGKYWIQVKWGGESIEKSFEITNNHTHKWEYKKQGTDTISVNCIEESGTCGEKASGKYLSINIADTYNYPERPAEEAILIKNVSGSTLTLDYEKLGVVKPECKYYKDVEGRPSGEALSGNGSLDAGAYWLQVNWGGETVEKSFVINKADRTGITVSMNNYDLKTKKKPAPQLNMRFGENEEQPEVTFYYSKHDKAAEGIKWSDKDKNPSKKGTYYMYAIIGETANYNGYMTPTKKFTVYADHKWDNLPKKLTSNTQKKKIQCANCKEVESITLPNKTINVQLGKQVTITSKDCTFALGKSAKVKKAYFTLSKKGKISTKAKSKYYKSVKPSVPVTVKAYGKTYSMTVKLKIPKPKVKIKCSKITHGNVSGRRFAFGYNIPDADRIQVRLAKGNTSQIKKDLDKYVSTPKSTGDSYIDLSDQFLKKKLKNKVTFKIVAYYGKKNKSEVLTKKISVK